MSQFQEIPAGRRFGRLTVSRDRVRGEKRIHLRCDCGKEVDADLATLNRGYVRSCGCLRDDASVARAKHGQAGGGRRPRTKAYTSWAAMRRRCENPKHPRYSDWGGRGITVCERWLDFRNFYEDMGDPPPGKTLDRIDNDGPYSPDNCRWATRHEQQMNRRPISM